MHLYLLNAYNVQGTVLHANTEPSHQRINGDRMEDLFFVCPFCHIMTIKLITWT